jgi:alpha-tubulin suppressor-like RCC1 family protein
MRERDVATAVSRMALRALVLFAAPAVAACALDESPVAEGPTGVGPFSAIDAGSPSTGATCVPSGGGCVAVERLAAGAFHTCALLADGSARCWGLSWTGQLGDGVPLPHDDVDTFTTSPTAVVGITNAVAIAAAEFHTCAALRDGTVKCWGTAALNELGIADASASASIPRTVPGISTAIDVVAADDDATPGFNCALLGDGTVACWGDNQFGELGSSDDANTSVPQVVPGLSGVTRLVTSFGGRNACAVLADQTVACWGESVAGQRGVSAVTGLPAMVDWSPAPVGGLTGVEQLSVGWGASCAALQGGAVACWGAESANALGILGSAAVVSCGDAGDAACAPEPTVLPEPVGASAIAMNNAACAVLDGGALDCWGSNLFGQLGRGSQDLDSNQPAPVVRASGAPLSGVRQVVAGYNHACALLDTGEVLCFGENSSGQLGFDMTAEMGADPSIVCYPNGPYEDAYWCSRVAIPVEW